MHEIAIANSVLDAVRAQAQLRPGFRVAKVGLRVGDLAGVDIDALAFCFEALVKDTPMQLVHLDVERRPQRHRCPRCGNEFIVIDYETQCPACGDSATVFIGGNELELAYLELEES